MWTWYLTRGSGAAALILLTGSVVIGIAHTLRWRTKRLPRFVVDDLHRSISLLALVLVAAHVVTSVLDSFAPVSIADAFVPFHGAYRPTWLGLGAIAFDLMLVLAATSVWRGQLGYRAWRTIHWLAWACWPPALVHALGTGSDVKRGWMLVLAAVCTAAVVVAALARLWQARGSYTLAAGVAGALGVFAGCGALVAWLPAGPLGHGWARRAGTPLSLLVPKRTSFTTPRPAPPARSAVQASARQDPMSAEAVGQIYQGTTNGGTALVDIALRIASPERRRVDVRIAGTPEAGGGVALRSSQVTFGPPHDPARYVGQLTALSGTRLAARLRPLRGGAIDLRADLIIDQGAGQAHGTVSVRPAG